jgi:hypothetical protein
MDYENIVSKMKEKNENKNVCIAEKDLLKKLVLCRYLLRPTEWSCLLEAYIKQKFNIQKAVDNLSGDGSIHYKNIEIKISLCTQNGFLNFVQLRPSHNIDYYIFLAYDMFDGKIGKYHWFLCEPEKLYSLIPDFGEYSHGTKIKNGEITTDSLKNSNFEYSLRMNTIKPGKSNRLWLKMIELFSNSEKQIYNTLNSCNMIEF